MGHYKSFFTPPNRTHLGPDANLYFQYSPSESIHLCIRENHSLEQFCKSSLVRRYLRCPASHRRCESESFLADISMSAAERRHRDLISAGSSPAFDQKFSRYPNSMRSIALSSRKISPQSRRLLCL